MEHRAVVLKGAPHPAGVGVQDDPLAGRPEFKLEVGAHPRLVPKQLLLSDLPQPAGHHQHQEQRQRSGQTPPAPAARLLCPGQVYRVLHHPLQVGRRRRLPLPPEQLGDGRPQLPGQRLEQGGVGQVQTRFP